MGVGKFPPPPSSARRVSLVEGIVGIINFLLFVTVGDYTSSICLCDPRTLPKSA